MTPSFVGSRDLKAKIQINAYLSLVSIIFLWRGLQENHKENNRPFARWHHFTTTTRILQDFVFLCLFGLLLFYPHWDYQIQRTENEMNSGLSSKKTPSFKWPFPFSFLKIHGQHHSSDPCTMRTKLGSLRLNVFNGLPLPWSIRTTDEWIPTPEDYF